jgi:hypothetical protein
MRKTIFATLAACALAACSADVKVDENQDTTALSGDTAVATPTVPTTGDTALLSADTSTTAVTDATTDNTASPATSETTTPSTSPSTTPSATPSTPGKPAPTTPAPTTPPPSTPPPSTPPPATPPPSTPPPSTPTASTGTNGKDLFVANKCNACHGVKSQGIAKDTRDLSTIGAKHDAAWITAFIKGVETLNGKKHAKKFTGSDADAATIGAWLAGLK